MGVFSADDFDQLQKKLGLATGFSFSIIDYRGGQVLPGYYQESYRNYLSRAGEDESCQMHAAFAAARAAITNVPYIYLCPCGLVKVAIPIVVHNQYLGAIICGHVRCDDRDTVDPETKLAIIQKDFPISDYRIREDLLQDMPVFTAERIRYIADMVFYVIEEMCRKQEYVLRMGDDSRNRLHLQDLRKKNKELEEQINRLEKNTLKVNLMPQTMLNMFVTISSLAIMEDAAMTQDVVKIYSSILRYYIEYHKDDITLDRELEQIGNYFDVLQIQYENRIKLDIKCDEKVKAQKLPKLTLLPLAEYIVNVAVLGHGFKGDISCQAKLISGRCVIIYELKSDDHTTEHLLPVNHMGNNSDIRKIYDQLNTIEKRVAYAYQDDYKLTIDADKIILDIPRVDNMGS